MDQTHPTQQASAAESPPLAPVRRSRLPAWIAWPCRCCWTCVKRTAQFLLIAWAALAVYYSNLPWAWARLVLGVALAAFGVWAMWVRPSGRMRWAYAAAYALVVAWWICIPPLQYRP